MSLPDFSLPLARRTWVRRLLACADDSHFDPMARELFAWQFAHVPAYHRLCEGRGITPERLASWREIPAVPQQLFKLEDLFGHGSRPSTALYETSGTTTGQPGRQRLLSTDLYRLVSVEGARQAGLFRAEPELHFLVPSPAEMPHSSLSAMFGFWRKQSRQSGPCFWMRRGQFTFEPLRNKLLASSRAGRPIGLAGTAFSFVHLLDAWADLPRLPLPAGSWLLETGGFKGRSREVPKAELYAQMSQLFSVPDDSIWNEYGMSELSSQAYARGTAGLHVTPPWTRVLVWDPARNREARIGQQGLIRWFDLANTDSVFALQTLDLAERTANGFRLIGRLPRTEPRGCSLGIEDLVRLVSTPRLAT